MSKRWMQSDLNEARRRYPSYFDPTITTGSTTIKAAHINDLRNGVK